MKIEARWIVAVVILLFSWKGADVEFPWPPARPAKVTSSRPGDDVMAWATPVRPILPKMIVSDRVYLANLYDAMAFVLSNDGERASPIIADTSKFAEFHAGTLGLAIRRANVGKYAGLGEAIDEVFMEAVGADVQPVTPEVRRKLIEACGALSWTMNVGRDE